MSASSSWPPSSCVVPLVSSSWLISTRCPPCPSLGTPSSTCHSDTPTLLLLAPLEPETGHPQTSLPGRDPCGHRSSCYQAQHWRRTQGGRALPPATMVVMGKRGNTGWLCCAASGSKACGSLASLCGIIAACPPMWLPFSDRLDMPPVQAGHRPLSHTVQSQHLISVLRDKTKELEQSQASDGTCTSSGSKSHITPLQIHSFKPMANGATGIPCHGDGAKGAGIMDTAPHPGAADPFLHLCPGHCFWWQMNCCPCSPASSLG